MDGAPVIECRTVSSSRGGFSVLEEVSLAVAAGESCFVMGATGSGKSALLKTLAGIRVPDSGEVLFRGVDLAGMTKAQEREFRRSTGFVFQDAALWANQSLFDNLALPARVNQPGWGKAEIESAVRRAAELVGYDDDLGVRPSELSSGERKLIGLARALVLDPELLFMDEPGVNLDEESLARLLDLEEALKARGRTLVVVTANSASVSRLADTVAVLRGGRILAFGTFDEAVGWTDPGIRAVTGRLKPRAPRLAPIDGLAAAWAEALAEGADAAAPSPEPGGGPCSAEEEVTLGDIINGVQGQAEGAGGAGEVQP